MTTFAYIRTSTNDQNSALQRDGTLAAGIPEKYVYTDEGVSGSLARRRRLDALLDRLDHVVAAYFSNGTMPAADPGC